MGGGGVGGKKSLIASPDLYVFCNKPHSFNNSYSKRLHLALLNNICPGFKSRGDHPGNTEMGQDRIGSNKVT